MATDSYINEANDNVDRLVRLAKSLLCTPANIREYLHEDAELPPEQPDIPDPTTSIFKSVLGVGSVGPSSDIANKYNEIAEEEAKKITASKLKKAPDVKPPANTQLLLDIISESKRKAANIINFIKSQENCNYNSASIAKCFSESIDTVINESTAEQLYELSKTVSDIVDNNLIDIKSILDGPVIDANDQISIISSLLYLDQTLYYKLNTLNRGSNQSSISK